MVATVTELFSDQQLKTWDEYVIGHAQGSFVQISAWGKVKSQFGWRVQVVAILEDGVIVGGAQLFIKKLPFSQELYYIPYGPLWDKGRLDVAKQLLEALRHRAKTGLIFKIEPQVQRVGTAPLDEEISQGLPKQFALEQSPETGQFVQLLKEYGFSDTGHSQQPEATLMMDLSLSPDQLQAGMRQTTRRYIRQAERAGLTVEEVSSVAGLEQFYSILQQVDARKQFGIHTLAYYRAVFEAFGQQVHIFLVKQGEDLLGGYFLIRLGLKSWELYGGVTEQGQQVKANYLLKWFSIVAMQKIGVVDYDQWGIAPDGQPKHFLSGVTYFKEGFGGRKVAWLGGWDQSSKPLLYKLAKLSKKL